MVIVQQQYYDHRWSVKKVSGDPKIIKKKKMKIQTRRLASRLLPRWRRSLCPNNNYGRFASAVSPQFGSDPATANVARDRFRNIIKKKEKKEIPNTPH